MIIMAYRKRWRWRINADQRPGGLLAPHRPARAGPPPLTPLINRAHLLRGSVLRVAVFPALHCLGRGQRV
jgi:hypothetical protein